MGSPHLITTALFVNKLVKHEWHDSSQLGDAVILGFLDRQHSPTAGVHPPCLAPCGFHAGTLSSLSSPKHWPQPGAKQSLSFFVKSLLPAPGEWISSFIKFLQLVLATHGPPLSCVLQRAGWLWSCRQLLCGLWSWLHLFQWTVSSSRASDSGNNSTHSVWVDVSSREEVKVMFKSP